MTHQNRRNFRRFFALLLLLHSILSGRFPPPCHCEGATRPWQSASFAMRCIARLTKAAEERIPTPVCALVRNDREDSPPLCHCEEGKCPTWQSPAVRFPVHRSSRNPATLPREIPTALKGLGMTKKPPSPRVIAREQRDRGNPFPFVIARSNSDVAISCGKVFPFARVRWQRDAFHCGGLSIAKAFWNHRNSR